MGHTHHDQLTPCTSPKRWHLGSSTQHIQKEALHLTLSQCFWVLSHSSDLILVPAEVFPQPPWYSGIMLLLSSSSFHAFPFAFEIKTQLPSRKPRTSSHPPTTITTTQGCCFVVVAFLFCLPQSLVHTASFC